MFILTESTSGFRGFEGVRSKQARLHVFTGLRKLGFLIWFSWCFFFLIRILPTIRWTSWKFKATIWEKSWMVHFFHLFASRTESLPSKVKMISFWTLPVVFWQLFVMFKSNSIGSMYGILFYIWLKFMVIVGKYSIHGAYGKPLSKEKLDHFHWSRYRFSF